MTEPGDAGVSEGATLWRWSTPTYGTAVFGVGGVHFFTRGKVVTSMWLDPSHPSASAHVRPVRSRRLVT